MLTADDPDVVLERLAEAFDAFGAGLAARIAAEALDVPAANTDRAAFDPHRAPREFDVGGAAIGVAVRRSPLNAFPTTVPAGLRSSCRERRRRPAAGRVRFGWDYACRSKAGRCPDRPEPWRRATVTHSACWPHFCPHLCAVLRQPQSLRWRVGSGARKRKSQNPKVRKAKKASYSCSTGLPLCQYTHIRQVAAARAGCGTTKCDRGHSGHCARIRVIEGGILTMQQGATPKRTA